ncbi:DUF397 domain-containing protein [Saccharopolyspora sp. 5N102]|uniref:DUF397 domain-containing protein n=1 Tax=Saccharopolyspora sp. 5N102 TaxID=3375155 RepID=UPI00378EA72A
MSGNGRSSSHSHSRPPGADPPPAVHAGRLVDPHPDLRRTRRIVVKPPRHRRKSSRSASGGECVEVALNIPGVTAIRDSKDPSGPVFVSNRPRGRAS